MASILNMFGYVDGSGGKDKNLSIWAEGFKNPDLDGNISKQEIWNVSAGGSNNTGANKPLTNEVTSATLTHNGVTWKYTNQNSTIKLEIDTSGSNKKPNLYRAGYTGIKKPDYFLIAWNKLLLFDYNYFRY